MGTQDKGMGRVEGAEDCDILRDDGGVQWTNGPHASLGNGKAR